MYNITKFNFGKTKHGDNVFVYSLKNNFLEIEILNFGGTIKSIFMPDKKGNIENVVLGFDNIQDYEQNISAHLGSIVGRTSGRIKNGLLNINNKIYHLSQNNFKNNLHGYPDFFAKKIWNVKEKLKKNSASLILTRTSPHLESNFPGEIDFKIKYTLKKNDLIIEYCGKAKADTYMNLTNHSYFNLSGNSKENIGSQIITVSSNNFIEVDEQTLPFKISSVNNRVFDLRNGKYFNEIIHSLDDQIKIVNNGLDHPFIFHENEELKASFYHEQTGRILKVYTDQPVGVIYTGNYLSDIKEKINNKKIENHFGFCIETQDYPDVFNFLPNKAILYNKDTIYKQKTVFSFEIN